jgi:hypothetical protein
MMMMMMTTITTTAIIIDANANADDVALCFIESST